MVVKLKQVTGTLVLGSVLSLSVYAASNEPPPYTDQLNCYVPLVQMTGDTAWIQEQGHTVITIPAKVPVPGKGKVDGVYAFREDACYSFPLPKPDDEGTISATLEFKNFSKAKDGKQTKSLYLSYESGEDFPQGLSQISEPKNKKGVITVDSQTLVAKAKAKEALDENLLDLIENARIRYQNEQFLIEPKKLEAVKKRHLEAIAACAKVQNKEFQVALAAYKDDVTAVKQPAPKPPAAPVPPPIAGDSGVDSGTDAGSDSDSDAGVDGGKKAE